MKILAGILFILLAVNASQAATKAEKVSPRDIVCPSILEVAKSVMTARQSGTSVTAIMDVINKSDTKKDTMKEMVYNAYSEPLYHSEEYQQSAITEFSNQYYITCMSIYK